MEPPDGVDMVSIELRQKSLTQLSPFEAWRDSSEVVGHPEVDPKTGFWEIKSYEVRSWELGNLARCLTRVSRAQAEQCSENGCAG